MARREPYPGKQPMTSFHIRGLTDEELTKLDQLARQAKQSRQAYVLNLIREHLGENKPDVVIGWLKLDRWGEKDEREEVDEPLAICPVCGDGIDPNAAYVAVIADGRVIGPYCNECATSE